MRKKKNKTTIFFSYICLVTNPKLLAAKASQLDKILNHKLEELRISKINIVKNQIRLGEHITDYLNVRF